MEQHCVFTVMTVWLQLHFLKKNSIYLPAYSIKEYRNILCRCMCRDTYRNLANTHPHWWVSLCCCCRTVSLPWVQPGTRVWSRSCWTASLRAADTLTTAEPSTWWGGQMSVWQMKLLLVSVQLKEKLCVIVFQAVLNQKFTDCFVLVFLDTQAGKTVSWHLYHDQTVCCCSNVCLFHVFSSSWIRVWRWCFGSRCPYSPRLAAAPLPSWCPCTTTWSLSSTRPATTSGLGCCDHGRCFTFHVTTQKCGDMKTRTCLENASQESHTYGRCCCCDGAAAEPYADDTLLYITTWRVFTLSQRQKRALI